MMTRRGWCTMALSLFVWPLTSSVHAANQGSGLPLEVAGIKIPRSRLAARAAQWAQQWCPDYLFNHSIRTFLFGALALQRKGLSYNADEAFTAAALHDLGLLPRFASPSRSFEIDGAEEAQRVALDSGLDAAGADIVWHGVALHDVRFAITQRAGPEAMLVALGAGSDVDGPELATDEQKRQCAEILAAFPRLQFKKRFTALLIDHCHRKPTSQRGTWLEGLCREQVPGAWTQTTEEEIEAAPFAE